MLNLPFGLNKSKDSSKFLTLDITAEGAKCIAFYNEENGLNKIIGVGKQPVEENAVRSGNIIDPELAYQALEQAVFQATADLEEPIHNAIFGISGDMCINLMTTARVVRGSVNPVTENELNALTKKIVESSFNEAGNTLMQTTGTAETELELITSTPVYSKVDEKYTNSPAGAMAETIEVALYSAFSPTHHIKMLQKLAKKLHLNLMAISSEMYGLVTSLKLSKGSHLDCVIIDIGSDTTDIGIVFGGGIVTTRTLNIGGKHFTEAISQKMGLTYREADNIKKSYALGKLAKSETMVVQNCLQEVLDVWLSGVALTFGEFTGVKTFSPNIYLTGGSMQLPDIMELIRKEPWTHSIPFKNPPEFTQLTMADITKVQDSTSRAQNSEFILPAALSIVYLEMKGEVND